MLGRLGDLSDAAVSAAYIANRPFFLFHMLMFGATSGAAVLCSQYWGKKDIATINSVAGVTLMFLLPFCIIFTAAGFFFAQPLMSLFSNETETVAMAAVYLRIIVFSFVFILFTGLFTGILRSVEKVKVPVIATLTGITINIFLNFALIYGRFGFPALGVRGAAIGTVISRAIELSIILAYIIFFEKTVRFSLKKMLAARIIIIKDFFRYSLPVVVNEFTWGFGVVIHTSIIGNMAAKTSGDQIAAYTIASMIEQIAFMSIIGFSTVCCIIIGKAIGEGKDSAVVVKYARSFIALAICVSFIFGGAAFVFRDFIIDIFDDISVETKIYASQLFTVVSVFILFKTFNCVGIVGIFRGGGDTKTGMLIDAGFMYLLGIPLGFCAANFLKLDVPFVFAFLVSDELLKFPVIIWRYKSRRWIRNITRERHELGK
jgi:putative MATE family efflux protein